MLYYARPTKPKSAFVHIFHSELCVLVDFVYFFWDSKSIHRDRTRGLCGVSPTSLFRDLALFSAFRWNQFLLLSLKAEREKEGKIHISKLFMPKEFVSISRSSSSSSNESANLRESERVVGGGGWRREWSTVQYIKQNSQKLNTQQKNSIAPATPREWVKLHGKTDAH